MTDPGAVRSRVQRIVADGGGAEIVWDLLAAEEPMEIRVGFGPEGRRSVRTIGVTMRTPGHDDELAVGFLLGERLICSADEVEEVGREEPEDAGRSIDRIIRVDLKPGVEVDLDRFARNVLTNSSCGVCGSATLRALNLDGCRPGPGRGPVIDAEVVHRLPEALRGRQLVFARTGGLHAAAMVDEEGGLIAVREDIGRHNAVDKLVGARALGTLDGPSPGGSAAILLVSGRAGFEIVQKAVTAGIPVVAAVGAPSSLAVEVAEAFGLTLLGFVGPERFNVYSGPRRIRVEPRASAPLD
ncbi:formate dehydrogenase accessory sulfurtransferase FdhD [Tautonia sociabilis]|uniref:Sulfur carrier protein FdhD n=1 Tax=Tautonia sociabilis TaxID=2080755 RepID=A0A432MKM8_9BACT|nr:formate dehydrogenase accessory sulfurtransferase FdhD [Tautonia sociabilis]RUL87767.1 formate dehydrogenase accessory sulfurtransferase FdhD [Tautonia sociabilis]